MYLSPAEGQRVLDIGCGDGRALEVLRNRGWSVMGIEPDLAAVERAMAKGLAVECRAVEELGVHSGDLDAVTMSHVIEHFEAPESALRTAYKFLRPGGVMVVVTPNAKSLGHTVFGENWMHLDPPRHLQIFSPHALVVMARRVGFSVKRVFTTVRDADIVWVSSTSIRKTGAFDLKQPHSSMSGRCFLIAEAVSKRVRPETGEEIVLIASRERGD